MALGVVLPDFGANISHAEFPFSGALQPLVAVIRDTCDKVTIPMSIYSEKWKSITDLELLEAVVYCDFDGTRKAFISSDGRRVRQATRLGVLVHDPRGSSTTGGPGYYEAPPRWL